MCQDLYVSKRFKAIKPKGAGLAYRVITGSLRPFMMLFTIRDWRGGKQLTSPGGVVVAMNHLSWFDPFVAGHFVHDHGRQVRFLAKAEIFKIPGLGAVLKSAGQIPVKRKDSEAAAGSLLKAMEAVRAGQCIVIYPEGTLTRDPNLWPMSSKTGAARIALTTGVPVIPAAQWGPNHVLKPYGKWFYLLPRKTMHVWAGPPVNLDDLRDKPITASTLREATDRIMKAVTDLLAEQRGIPAPDRLMPRTAVPPRKPESA